jgi:hypothetical protein
MRSGAEDSAQFWSWEKSLSFIDRALSDSRGGKTRDRRVLARSYPRPRHCGVRCFYFETKLKNVFDTYYVLPEVASRTWDGLKTGGLETGEGGAPREEQSSGKVGDLKIILQVLAPNRDTTSHSSMPWGESNPTQIQH